MVQANRRKASSSTDADLGAERLGAAPALRVANAAASSVESPARRMQQQIELELSAPTEKRWSVRRTTIFLIVTNGLFWMGAALAVRAVV